MSCGATTGPSPSSPRAPREPCKAPLALLDLGAPDAALRYVAVPDRSAEECLVPLLRAAADAARTAGGTAPRWTVEETGPGKAALELGARESAEVYRWWRRDLPAGVPGGDGAERQLPDGGRARGVPCRDGGSLVRRRAGRRPRPPGPRPGGRQHRRQAHRPHRRRPAHPRHRPPRPHRRRGQRGPRGRGTPDGPGAAALHPDAVPRGGVHPCRSSEPPCPPRRRRGRAGRRGGAPYRVRERAAGAARAGDRAVRGLSRRGPGSGGVRARRPGRTAPRPLRPAG
ncbi:hypothetical protein LT493_23830 [Streptomyces tricolor]|nr:hypothetical protein [Streptomyces tricolor]